jgi:hypothetical protein
VDKLRVLAECCLRLRNRRPSSPFLSGPTVMSVSPEYVVVSSLVSSVYVRLRSSVFELVLRCRSRTSALFGELLSQLLKIGRSMVLLWSRP